MHSSSVGTSAKRTYPAPDVNSVFCPLVVDRIVDDYAFHDYVRPQINAALSAQGIADHTYLLSEQAVPVADLNRAALWNRAAAILKQLYPAYHIAAIQITLPWNRTFETGIEVALAPNL